MVELGGLAKVAPATEPIDKLSFASYISKLRNGTLKNPKQVEVNPFKSKNEVVVLKGHQQDLKKIAPEEKARDLHKLKTSKAKSGNFFPNVAAKEPSLLVSKLQSIKPAEPLASSWSPPAVCEESGKRLLRSAELVRPASMMSTRAEDNAHTTNHVRPFDFTKTTSEASIRTNVSKASRQRHAPVNCLPAELPLTDCNLPKNKRNSPELVAAECSLPDIKQSFADLALQRKTDIESQPAGQNSVRPHPHVELKKAEQDAHRGSGGYSSQLLMKAKARIPAEIAYKISADHARKLAAHRGSTLGSSATQGGFSETQGFTNDYNQTVRSIKDKIEQKGSFAITAHFQALDTDDSGALDRAEFRRAIEMLNVAPSDAILDKILATTDKDGDGTVDYREFTDAIRMGKIPFIRTGAQARCSVLDPDLPFGDPVDTPFGIMTDAEKNLKEYDAKVDEMFGALEQCFQKFDSDGSGDIDKSEFIAAMQHLNETRNLQLNDKDIKKLFKLADADCGGSIDYKEFVQAFAGGGGARFIPEFFKPKSIRCSTMGAPWQWNAENPFAKEVTKIGSRSFAFEKELTRRKLGT